VASGAAPAYELAFQATQNHGRIIAIGVPRASIPVNILDMVKRELVLVATNQGTKQELAEALEVAADHNIQPVYEIKELDQINEGFQDMLKGKISGRLVYKMG
jgi:propanol-preferring alcohol dehydrogenase